MTRRRSRLQILVDVLRVIEGGTRKPTRIMHKGNLSWRPLQKILGRLVEDELVTVRESKRGVCVCRRYSITEKGAAVIGLYRDLRSLLGWKVDVELR